jgi:nucleoside-triphosphatase
MPTAPRILLVTGQPGVGKSTLIRRVAERLAGLDLGGFHTGELREDGRRVGFRLESFDGRSLTFAHVDFPGPARVSKYGVDVAALDRLAQELLAPRPEADLYLVDEIGKMECLSPRFVAAMQRLLASSRVAVATVGMKGEGFIAQARGWPGAVLWEVTRANRDRLVDEVLGWLRRAGIKVAPAQP